MCKNKLEWKTTGNIRYLVDSECDCLVHTTGVPPSDGCKACEAMDLLDTDAISKLIAGQEDGRE